MDSTVRFSQARANTARHISLRERLARSVHLGGELLALTSLVVALATSLLVLATLVGP